MLFRSPQNPKTPKYIFQNSKRLIFLFIMGATNSTAQPLVQEEKSNEFSSRQRHSRKLERLPESQSSIDSLMFGGVKKPTIQQAPQLKWSDYLSCSVPSCCLSGNQSELQLNSARNVSSGQIRKELDRNAHQQIIIYKEKKVDDFREISVAKVHSRRKILSE